MSISPVNISQIGMPRRFVKAVASRSLIPLLMLEATVEAGRTYQAHKRGGFDEARERITEEMIGALFWFSGVPLFDKLIDKFVGQKHLPTTDFDLGKDAGRDALSNFINKNKSHFKDEETARKFIAKYRVGKVATAVILANCLVGIAVPKLNQAITRTLRKNRSEKTQEQQQNQLNQPFQNYTMDTFLNKDDKKNVAFGKLTPQMMLEFVNTFENTPKYQLLSEDFGSATGRAICARNKYERIEVLFRDITSCFFYMFNMPIIAGLLNRIEDGNSKRLDPVSAKVTTDHFIDVIKANNGAMSIEEFSNRILGDTHLKERVTPELSRELKQNNGHIKLEKFLEMFSDVDKETARKMSALQPKFNGESILTRAQIEDLFKGGRINSPEYLSDLYTVATSNDKLFKVGKPAFLDEFKFVSTNALKGQKDLALDYFQKIINRAEKLAKKSGGNAEITEKLLKTMSRENLIKNALNWGTGFAISALFLSTLIPKIQYLITKTLTGSNDFPGTTEYNKKA